MKGIKAIEDPWVRKTRGCKEKKKKLAFNRKGGRRGGNRRLIHLREAG